MATSRRDFLYNNIVRAGERARAAEENRAREAAKNAPVTYMEYSRHAMASDFVLFANAGEYSTLFDTAAAALDEVSRLEQLLTYFDSESEISRINRLAGLGWVETEPEVYDLLKYCRQLDFDTHGAYDITATPLCEVWGFMRRKGVLPEEEERRTALESVSTERITWDDEGCRLKFERPGVKISLGSVGKGLALDRAGDVLAEAGVTDFLFHGGASSVLARGARRGREDWLIGLHHPLRPKERIREITLRDRALGTSGSATQFFWSGGKRYGHILDPRTGWPAVNVLSTTVLAPTAREADALATAFYVLGIEQTRAFCEKRPDLAVIFVLPKGANELEMVEVGSL